MVETTQRPGAQTFPQLLLMHAKTRPDRPAFREKDLGIWQTTTWSQVADEVRAFACGLAALGFKRGMSLAIIGNNCPRLYWAMSATQCLGGMPVPLYQDAPAADMSYVLNDAEIDFVVAEDQEQVDKVFEIKLSFSGGTERPTHIIYDDERGMRNYRQPELSSFASVQELGRAYDQANPTFFMDQINALTSDDIAIILYTSGTTGKPKGVSFACGNDRDGADPGRFRPVERDRRCAVLPAAGLGGRLPVFVRPDPRGRLLPQLPGVAGYGHDRPARNRTDVLFRAAAHL